MVERPTLHTARLMLRPFQIEDAPALQVLVGAQEIARTTMLIPHPYEDGMAETWIAGHQDRFEAGQAVDFAITVGESGELCGSIGLRINPAHSRADFGYWIGVPYWNRGYGTEALRALIDYGFGTLNLNRIGADHFANNPASGRVMRKVGLRHEGTLRQHYCKWGEFIDGECYGLLRQDWELARK